MPFDTRQPLSIQAIRTINVGRGSGGGGPVFNWQLPESNFIAAKRPLSLVQPDINNIGADSFYLWAEPGEKYSVPICCNFGSFPYHFSVDGPEGMTIGSFLMLAPNGIDLIRPDNYGVVEFEVPESGMSSFTFTVTITDQNLDTLVLTLSPTVDASKFIHVAPIQQGVGDGSKGDPLGSWRDLWKDDVNDSTFAGKIVKFHGGNYELFGDPVANDGNVNFNGAIKPKTLMAVDGEVPAFDCQQARIIMNGGNMNDCAFIGLSFENGRQDVSNAHFIWATGDPARPMFWRNKFNNLGPGVFGNDNPACIFIPQAGSDNPVILSNEFSGLTGGGGNGVAAWDTYSIINGLFEDNELSDSTSDHGFWCKGQHVNTSVRMNRCTNNFTGLRPLTMTLSSGQTATKDDGNAHDVEVIYNIIKNDAAGQTVNHVACQLFNTITSGNAYNVSMDRNTFIGRVRQYNQDVTDMSYANNLYDGQFPSDATENNIAVFSGNEQISSGDIDEAGSYLSGAIQYRGTKGHMISTATQED